MRDKKSFFARMAMTLIAMLTTMTALADAEPVQISDADSWCSFARRVSNGETNLYAVMTAALPPREKCAPRFCRRERARAIV